MLWRRSLRTILRTMQRILFTAITTVTVRSTSSGRSTTATFVNTGLLDEPIVAAELSLSATTTMPG